MGWSASSQLLCRLSTAATGDVLNSPLAARSAMAVGGRAMDGGGACDEGGAPGCGVGGRGSRRPGVGKSGGWQATAATAATADGSVVVDGRAAHDGGDGRVE